MTSNELEIFKQSILDDVRVMMQSTGQVTQYIGARYVPLFAEPFNWDINKEYEPLTIVTNQGNSYTSRQFVPKGVDISDTSFWATTGNYNAQIEQYRLEVKAMKSKVDALTKAVDGVGETIAPLQTMLNEGKGGMLSLVYYADYYNRDFLDSNAQSFCKVGDNFYIAGNKTDDSEQIIYTADCATDTVSGNKLTLSKSHMNSFKYVKSTNHFYTLSQSKRIDELNAGNFSVVNSYPVAKQIAGFGTNDNGATWYGYGMKVWEDKGADANIAVVYHFNRDFSTVLDSFEFYTGPLLKTTQSASFISDSVFAIVYSSGVFLVDVKQKKFISSHTAPMNCGELEDITVDNETVYVLVNNSNGFTIYATDINQSHMTGLEQTSSTALYINNSDTGFLVKNPFIPNSGWLRNPNTVILEMKQRGKTTIHLAGDFYDISFTGHAVNLNGHGHTAYNMGTDGCNCKFNEITFDYTDESKYHTFNRSTIITQSNVNFKNTNNLAKNGFTGCNVIVTTATTTFDDKFPRSESRFKCTGNVAAVTIFNGAAKAGDKFSIPSQWVGTLGNALFAIELSATASADYRTVCIGKSALPHNKTVVGAGCNETGQLATVCFTDVAITSAKINSQDAYIRKIYIIG